MSFFGNVDKTGVEKSEDRVGGYTTFKTNIYKALIKMAYLSTSQGGAKAVNYLFELDGKPYRETVYYTSKKGDTFYMTKPKDKDEKPKKRNLPGFEIVDGIALCATGEDLQAQEPHVEMKIVKVYDKDAGGEVPKSVPVITSLLEKEVFLAIFENLENKTAKNSAGDYEPIADTRVTNSIDKVFEPNTMMTVVEAENGLEKGAFHEVWLEKNADKQRDQRTIKEGQGGQSGRPTASRAPSAAPQAGAPAGGKSLFGKKG